MPGLVVEHQPLGHAPRLVPGGSSGDEQDLRHGAAVAALDGRQPGEPEHPVPRGDGCGRRSTALGPTGPALATTVVPAMPVGAVTPAARSSIVAPGSGLSTVTAETARGVPRSNSRPTPVLRPPRSALAYRLVDQADVADGSASMTSCAWEAFSRPSPSGSKSRTAATVIGAEGAPGAAVAPGEDVGTGSPGSRPGRSGTVPTATPSVYAVRPSAARAATPASRPPLRRTQRGSGRRGRRGRARGRKGAQRALDERRAGQPGAGRPAGRVDRADDELVQLAAEPGPDLARRADPAPAVRRRREVDGARAGPAAGQGRVQQRSEPARVDLRGRAGPDDRAGADRRGDREVGDAGPAVGRHDHLAGVEREVRYAGGVGGHQRGGQRAGERHGGVGLERAVAQQGTEGQPGEPGADDVGDVGAAAAGRR